MVQSPNDRTQQYPTTRLAGLPLVLRATRGLSLAETLVATAIGSVLLIGSAKSLSVALQSGAVARSILTENDFRTTLSKSLRGHCFDNFKPDKIDNSDSDKKSRGIGTLEKIYSVTGIDTGSPQEIPVISEGNYKKDIEVVKMELKEKLGPDGNPIGTARTFIAFYKKNGLGNLNTVGGEECSASDISGCFSQSCDVADTWQTEGTPPTTTLESCEVLNCNEGTSPILANIGCEKTHGSGFSIAGFDGQGKPICKNLTADANPCRFGTRLKGYDASGRPKCTTPRLCPTGYLLQADGSCFIEETSEPKKCIEVNSLDKAKSVCSSEANLKSYCHYFIKDKETITLNKVKCATTCRAEQQAKLLNRSGKKVSVNIYRRGSYNRVSGKSHCYTEEISELTLLVPNTDDNDHGNLLRYAILYYVSSHNEWRFATHSGVGFWSVDHLGKRINRIIDKMFTWGQ